MISFYFLYHIEIVTQKSRKKREIITEIQLEQATVKCNYGKTHTFILLCLAIRINIMEKAH